VVSGDYGKLRIDILWVRVKIMLICLAAGWFWALLTAQAFAEKVQHWVRPGGDLVGRIQTFKTVNFSHFGTPSPVGSQSVKHF